MRRVPVRSGRFQPGVESLERRELLAVASSQFVLLNEMEPNDVLSQSNFLATLAAGQGVEVRGTIGNGASLADVDWYRFDAAGAAKVTLTLSGAGVLTLYDQNALATPLGYQQLGQAQGSDASPAALALNVQPGAYFVAVSGAGNAYFNPFIADSGALGATGPYDLTVSAAPADSNPPPPSGIVGGEAQGGAVDDTLATAQSVQDITQAGLVQRPGVIGDDPFYSAGGAGNDVDMYRFSVSGPGRYVLTAEAFAGRIGSPLDAALTLFRPTGGTNADGSPAWQLVAGNDNSFNPVTGPPGQEPLWADPLLFAGLTAGDYVIAVSSSGNYADPLRGLLPGQLGVFDPNQSHSGTGGSSTGPYVLNLYVQPASPNLPWVVQTSLPGGASVSGPPTTFTVQFSGPVNLPELAPLSGNLDPSLDTFPVFFVDGSGQRHDVKLLDYDAATNTATFASLDRLTDGAYTLHLSGPGGLTDLAGQPLVANDPSCDCVIAFAVTDSPAAPAPRAPAAADDSFAAPTDLGILFPAELAHGITVTRDFTGAAAPLSDTADYYRFTLTQKTDVLLALCGPGLTVAGRPVLLDARGNDLTAASDPSDPGSHVLSVILPAGTYTIRVGTWSASSAAAAVYQLHIRQGAVTENPTPLSVAPVPAYRLRLDSLALPPAPAALPPSSPSAGSTATAPPVQLVLPGQGTPSITATVDRAPPATVVTGTTTPGSAMTALSVGPVGVVGTTGSPDAASPPRLVLPGTEFPAGEPAVAQAGTPAAVAVPFPATPAGFPWAFRLLWPFTFDWMRIPLVPGPLPIEEADSPAGTVPEEAHAPASDQPAMADASVEPLVWAAALALVGGAELREAADPDSPPWPRARRWPGES
jgi:hypothetical protein